MTTCIQPCYIVKLKLKEKVSLSNSTDMPELKITTAGDKAPLIKVAYTTAFTYLLGLLSWALLLDYG